MLHVPPQSASASAVTSKIEEFDQLLDRLRKQRDEFAAKVAVVQQAFEKVDHAVRALEHVRNTLADAIAQDVSPNPSIATAHREAATLTPARVIPLAKSALLKAGRPLKRGQLARLLESGGFALAGRDKSKNLGTVLWRHPSDFVTVEGLGYWVKGVPLKGVYDPERDDEPLPKTTFVSSRRE